MNLNISGTKSAHPFFRNVTGKSFGGFQAYKMAPVDATAFTANLKVNYDYIKHLSHQKNILYGGSFDNIQLKNIQFAFITGWYLNQIFLFIIEYMY